MSQHGVAKAGHVEKRRQRGKLFEKLENQTPFMGKFVQMRVQARPAEQGGHGNPLHAISSKVRAAQFYMNPPKTRKLFALVARFMVVLCATSCAGGSREIVSYFSSSASFDGCFKDFTIENLHPAIGNPLKELVAP